MPDPVVKSITVPVRPAKAFHIFTARLGDWWPLESHSRSASTGNPARSVEMDPVVGGKITETMADGSPAVWGIISEIEPAKSVAFSWHLTRAKGEQTHVKITFSPHEGGSNVKLVHAGFSALGTDASRQRDQYNAGWDFVFTERYGWAAQT